MKILLVEDNGRLRKSVMDYLMDEGFTVDGAADGEEGLYKIMNWDYDLLILDVMMPGRDGWEVLTRVRKLGMKMPVIMLTARDQLEDRVKGLDGGADDYLVKPFEMEELIARIRAAIRRSGDQPNPVIELGDITLDTSRRVVLLKNEPVELSAKEYALLEILITRRDSVVSRDFLYGRLFDEDDESLSNMLDVYVYRLRQKLGRDRIETRRGMGYIFCE